MFGLDSTQHLYDFKLNQWGLTRNQGENFEQYVERLLTSPVWNQNQDISLYDLRPEGAGLLNDYIKTVPHVYCKIKVVNPQSILILFLL